MEENDFLIKKEIEKDEEIENNRKLRRQTLIKISGVISFTGFLICTGFLINATITAYITGNVIGISKSNYPLIILSLFLLLWSIEAFLLSRKKKY